MDNLLLQALKPHIVQQLVEVGSFVELRLGKIIYEADSDISKVYFPDRGTLISLVAVSANRISVEVGMVGNEGLVGIPVFLGGKKVAYQVLVQGGGNALRVNAKFARELFAREEFFRKSVLSYIHDVLIYTSQTALCNRIHSVEQRLSSWLLMAQDLSLIHI